MKTHYTAFRCPMDLLAKMKVKAKAQRRSVSSYLIVLIENNTKDLPNKKAKAKAKKK